MEAKSERAKGNARRDEIIELKKSGPTYAEIGRRFGITKQRVRQILKGKPTRKRLTSVLRPCSE